MRKKRRSFFVIARIVAVSPSDVLNAKQSVGIVSEREEQMTHLGYLPLA